MKFAENFFKIFKKTDKPVNGTEAAPEVQASVEKKAMSPAEMKAFLTSVKERLDSIRKINNEKKSANTSEKIAKFEGKLETAKQKFVADFGVEYDPSFDNVKNAIKNREAGQTVANNQSVPIPDANLNQAAPDQAQAQNQAPVSPDQAQAQNQAPVSPDQAQTQNQDPVTPDQTQPNPDQVPSTPEPEVVEPEIDLPLNYRQHLEKLKIQEGKIETPGVRFIETNQSYLEEELKGLSDSLLAKELDKNLDSKLKELATKTGLSEDTIREIYQVQEESLVAEAKDEINKSASRTKRIGLAVTKTAVYMGAGVLFATSTIPTFGMGVGFGMGAIAVARVVDRLITDKVLAKDLAKKTAEIKAKKTDEEKITLQDRLAASISLKKKVEIEKVNLGEKGERTALIDKYIEEQNSLGMLNIPPDKLMDYKDKIIRTLEGLDDIDKINAEKEAALNKTTKLDKIIKTMDKVISGESTREKTVSAAVLAGLGLAARELPGTRLALSALAGYRLGGAVVDHYINKENQKYEASYNIVTDKKITNKSDYAAARKKLLDKNFQKNSPEEYLKLKKEVEETEDIALGSGNKKFNVAALNESLEKEIKSDKKYKNNDRIIKVVGRVGGAVVGLGVGGMVHELSRHLNHSHSGKTELTDEIVDEEPSADNNQVETDTTQTETVPVDTTAAGSSGEVAPGLEMPLVSGDSQLPDLEVPVPPSSGAVADATMVKPIGGLRGDSGSIIERITGNKPDSVSGQNLETPPASGGSKIPDLETSSASGSSQTPGLEEAPIAPKSSAYEDIITNENLKPGHTDSVWHSTNQIFKDHAAELGYKGDVNDAKALEAWSQIQTGKAINNSGELTDKVFEGNKIVLNQDAKGNYSIEIEKGDGFDPGHLERASQGGVKAEEVVAPKNSASELPNKGKDVNYEELKKQFIEKSKADIRAQHEFLYHDKHGIKIDDVVIKEGTENVLNNGKISSAVTSESVLFDHSPKSSRLGFEQDASSSSDSGNGAAAAQEVHSDVSGKTDNAANIETGKGSGESSSLEEAKADVNKSAVEDPSAYKSGSEFKDIGVDEAKKAFTSIENLKDLPNGARTNLGELVMAKRDGIYHFETKEYEKFHMAFNRLSETGQSDKFNIIRNGDVLDGKSLKEAIPLKQMLYDNLPDKRTSLAKELLKEIAKNKGQAEFFSEF